MDSVVDDGANRSNIAHIAHDRACGGEIVEGVAWTVAAQGGLGGLGDSAPSSDGRNVNVARGALVQDGATVATGREDELSLGASVAARAWNLSSRGFGAVGRRVALVARLLRWRKSEGVWHRGPILREGVEPRVGGHIGGGRCAVGHWRWVRPNAGRGRRSRRIHEGENASSGVAVDRAGRIKDRESWNDAR